MAISTHRWRPSANTKSGYSLDKKYKKSKCSKNKDRCLIEMKFENSSYFIGVNHPLHEVYRISKNRKNSLERLDSQSIATFSGMTGGDSHIKLYATEYDEGESVKYLTKFNDPFVRAFIISENKSSLEDIVNIVEIIKLGLEAPLWSSFRLIISSKNYDIKHEILGNHVTLFVPKPFTIKSLENNQEEDDKEVLEDEEYDDDFIDDNELDKGSSSTLFDEDEETRMIKTVAMNKFRDSRIILTNKKKQTAVPDVDPIERCFAAMMKILEDNIFSASKGLSELNLQVKHMLNNQDKNSNNEFQS